MASLKINNFNHEYHVLTRVRFWTAPPNPLAQTTFLAIFMGRTQPRVSSPKVPVRLRNASESEFHNG